MREPMAILGGAVLLGAVAWPYWQPALAECLVGGALLVLVALLGRRSPLAEGTLVLAAFLLGSAAAEPLDGAPDRGWVQGRVERATGLEAWVASPQGRWRLRTPEPVAVGERVFARVTAGAVAVRLPGSVAGIRDDQRAGARPAKAQDQLRVGRGRALPGLQRLALADHHGLLRALVSGQREGVDEETRELLRRTGTSHLLAISGLHVGLLAGTVGGLSWLLLRPLALGRAWRLGSLLPPVAAALVAVAYAMSVGAPASARRAAVMVVAAAGTAALGRRPRPWTLLGLAAGGVVLVEPGLVGDLGFQLSFSAVAGMLLVGPRLRRLLPPDSGRPLRWLLDSLGATLGATVGTLGLSALHFQQLSAVAPLANLLAAPLIGGLALPLALLGLLLPDPPGLLCLAMADRAVDLCLLGLRLLDRPLLHPAVGPAGALLLGALPLVRRWPAVAALLALVALGLRLQPRDGLRVTFLAVGQGDAALVEWADGRRWLVDGGPPSEAVLRYLRRRGIRRLDALVLSHPHDDHLGGLVEVAEALPVRALWAPRPPREDEAGFQALWAATVGRGATAVLPDDVPVRGLSGVRVEHPRGRWTARKAAKALNEESLVLRLDHGRHRVILLGDVEGEAEALLARALPRATLVKVAHHGSRSSSSAALVQRLRPAVAVVSAGRDNRFDHPHPRALGAWMGRGEGLPCGPEEDEGRACRTRVLRTDRDGTIEWSSDGARWRLRSWTAAGGWRAQPGPRSLRADPVQALASGRAVGVRGGTEAFPTGAP